MTDSGPDGPSFDPKSWGATKPDQGVGAGGDSSFDPKSWRRPAARRAERCRRGPWPVIAGVAVLALATGGAFMVWRGIRSREQPAPAPAPVAIAPPAQPATPVAAAPGPQRRALTLAGAGDLESALTGAGASPADAASAARAAAAKLHGASGELRVSVTLQPGPAGLQLARLEVWPASGDGAIVTRLAGGGLVAAAAAGAVAHKIKVVRGQMDGTSFYSSAVAAGVTDELIPAFAQAFAYDFDFQREIKPGDVFEAAIDQPTDPSGQPLGPGKLLYAALETRAKSIALYWFTPAGKAAGWYDGNGRSVIRSLMRTPVEGARISSPFGLRMHPVLGFMKMHNGTDFAAPVGTPIYAAGDAVVEFSGPKGPNGNFVKLLHPNGWETLYLHMNLIEPNVVAGAHVSQSQQIGQVGATGVDSAGHSTVTGPHLHYEVHINNTPVDPMSIPVGVGQSLEGPDRAAFMQERNRIDALRTTQNG